MQGSVDYSEDFDSKGIPMFSPRHNKNKVMLGLCFETCYLPVRATLQ